jgi:hypothetical protein
MFAQMTSRWWSVALRGVAAVLFGLVARSLRLRAHHDRDPLAGAQLAWAMPARSH